MKNMWEPDFVQIYEEPKLFIKTGVMCSEPYGFYVALADAFNADRHDADQIRTELSLNRLGDQISFTSTMNNLVGAEMERQTRSSLRDGYSVVYDGYINSPSKREHVAEAAKEYGAAVITIAMHAPMRLIEDRIEERYNQDQLGVPARFTSVAESQRTASLMRSSVIFPESGIEAAVHLDGTRTVNELIGAVVAYAANQITK